MNGAPKKGISPVYTDKQVVRTCWSFRYGFTLEKDDALLATFEREFKAVRLQFVTIARYICYNKPYLEVILECMDPCWKTLHDMTLKDASEAFYQPKITPIWKVLTYKYNLQKNNANYQEARYSLIISDKEISSAEVPPPKSPSTSFTLEGKS